MNICVSCAARISSQWLSQSSPCACFSVLTMHRHRMAYRRGLVLHEVNFCRGCSIFRFSGWRGSRCLASVTELSNKSGAIKYELSKDTNHPARPSSTTSVVQNLILFCFAQWGNMELQQCKSCPNVKIYRWSCSRRITPKPVLDYYSKTKPKMIFPPWYHERDTLAECKVSSCWIWDIKQQMQSPTSILDCKGDSRAFCGLTSMSWEGALSTPPSSPEGLLPWTQWSLMALDSLCTKENPSKSSHCDRQGEGLTQYPLSLALAMRHRSHL